MSTKAWCYNCEKSIVPSAEGLCPICNTDFIEYGGEDFNPEPAPQQAPRPAPQAGRPRGARSFRVVFPNFPGLPFLGGQGDAIGNMFQNIVEGIFGRLTGNNPTNNGDGRQMGDFFFGSEEQLQALADRLFRLNQQSLGSPPTSDEFMKSEGMKPIKYTEGCCAENVCSVCLEEFTDGEEVIVLPCKHGFHQPCLEPWLKMHSECPSCRHKLPSSD